MCELQRKKDDVFLFPFLGFGGYINTTQFHRHKGGTFNLYPKDYYAIFCNHTSPLLSVMLLIFSIMFQQPWETLALNLSSLSLNKYDGVIFWGWKKGETHQRYFKNIWHSQYYNLECPGNERNHWCTKQQELKQSSKENNNNWWQTNGESRKEKQQSVTSRSTSKEQGWKYLNP